MFSYDLTLPSLCVSFFLCCSSPYILLVSLHSFLLLGLHIIAALLLSLLSFHSLYPSQFHLLLLISPHILFKLVIYVSASFLLFMSPYFQNLFQARKLAAIHFFSFAWVIFQISRPYSNTGLIRVLNNFILIFIPILLILNIYIRL